MRVLVTGASGLIGSALVPALRAAGNEVVTLVRRSPRHFSERQWDPQSADSATYEGADAIVHLAGRNIAAGRWTAKAKNEIRASRVPVTEALAQGVAAAGARVLVSASAVGYYGDRGAELLTESSPPGSGFLASVTRDWEAATAPAADAGLRVVLLRTGVVLSARGGALAKMLPAFRLGLGGRLGSGRQWMSWIALADAVALIQHVLLADSIRGPVNVVAPNPATNADFTRALGGALRRPTIFSAPAFALRWMLGEMAEELLLASQRVEPAAALASGFAFRCPDLTGALERIVCQRVAEL